jgi:hypothetical protein
MYFMTLADGLQWNEKQYRGGPPYPQVICSKTYRSYVKPRIILNAYYNYHMGTMETDGYGLIEMGMLVDRLV